MKRLALLLTGLLCLLSAFACDEKKEGTEPKAETKTAPTPKIQVDPMIFLELHQEKITEIIQQNWSDCEGGLAALLRFTADHKSEFQTKMAGKPSNYKLPSSGGRRQITGLLMQWSKRCPDQIPRLNQSLKQLPF